MDKKEDRIIIRIIEIENSIKKIYDQLSVKNTKKKKDLLGYLEIASQMETDIINELDIKGENTEMLLNRFSYILKHKDYTEENKTLIEERFQNQIIDKFELNPFRETKETSKDYIEDNKFIIMRQFHYDFLNANTYYLQEAIKNEKKYTVKKALYNSLKTMIFTNKRKENLLIEQEELNTSNRNRCLVFGHNPEQVNEVYASEIQNILNQSLNECLRYNNESLKSEYYQGAFKYRLTNLKASLALLTNKEMSSVCTSFYANYINRTDNIEAQYKASESIANIKDSLGSELRKRAIKSENEKDKSKVKEKEYLN